MTNPTLLVSTFDNSLALIDSGGAGTWTGVAPTRYAPIGAQDGLWTEEGATNGVINPSFEDFDLVGWSDWGTPTRTADATETVYGGQSQKIVTSIADHGTINDDGGVGVVAGAGETWTVSAHVQGTGRVRFGIWPRNGGSEVESATFDSYQDIPADWTDQDARPSYTFTLPATTTSFYTIISFESVGTYYIDGVQAEESPYKTSYLDGGLGSGYAWSGTAHLSTSTRAASSVSFDQSGTARIDPASGAIAFRYKRLIDTAAEEVILTCGVAGAGTDYLEIGIDANDDPYMEWNSDNAGAERVTITDTIAIDTDYFFYFDWDSTTIRGSRDNGALGSDTRAAAEGDWSTGDLILSAAVGSHVIGPLAIFDRPLSGTERGVIARSANWTFRMLPRRRFNVAQMRPKAA